MADEPAAPAEDVPEGGAPAEGEGTPPNPGEGAPPEGDGEPSGDDAPKEPDWRTQMAGEDKDLAKLIKRFGSPAAVARALKDTKAQLTKVSASTGKLPEDATDDQKAEWRRANDIPDAPDAYDLSLKGVDWTDDDKAVLSDFTKAAHQLPVPLNKTQVKGVLQWYADKVIADQQTADIAAQKQQKATVTALRTEYGSDYERNVSLMKEYGQAQLGGDGWETLVEARLTDGTKLGDNPAFIRLIVESALERGDGLPFEGGAGGQGGQSDADMIKAHRELSAKASGGDKVAKAKMADPDYEKRIEAAYERQEKRETAKRTAA